MTPEEKDQVAKKISADLEKLAGEIEELKELTKPIPPSDAIGRVSRMDAINNKSVNEAALRQSEARVSKLNNALKRLDEKDFGKCARCSNDIPVGRLLLRPESRMCVNCASR